MDKHDWISAFQMDDQGLKQVSELKIHLRNPTFSLQLAKTEDLEDVLDILRDGKAFQRKQGFIQWTDDFPDPDEIIQDLIKEQGWFFMVDHHRAGYVLIAEDEPAYLQKTAWWSKEADEEPEYLVLHRVSLGHEWSDKGLGRTFLKECQKEAARRQIPWLRIDTHEDNKRMQHLLESSGWRHCGYVDYPFGRRLVYELHT